MNRILAGMQLLSTYDPDFDTCAQHDIFYVYSKKFNNLRDEDKKMLDEWGWYIDRENNTDLSSWYHYT